MGSHNYPYDAHREETSDEEAPASEPAPVECPECPACKGETKHIGDLGRRAHFRCIRCGWNCSERIA
jgi:transposase-like protein